MVEWEVFLDFQATLDQKKEGNLSHLSCTFGP
jgi:hypothetical protein